MADNVGYTEGSGKTIAADDVGGALHQRMKISIGADGSASDLAREPSPVANGSCKPTKVNVTSTPASLVTALTNRCQIIVQNRDTANSLYIGDSTVTASGATGGIEVMPGGSITLNLGPGVALYAVTDSATVEARVLELA